MIKVKTTSPELSFRIQGKRVYHDKITLVHLDSVVRGHKNDGSIIIVTEKKQEKIKNVKS